MDKEKNKWILDNLYKIINESAILSAIKKDDQDFIVEKLLDAEQESLETLLKEKYDAEELILIHIRRVLRRLAQAIQKNKSRHLRELVGDYFTLRLLGNEFDKIERKIWNLKLGEHEKAKKLRKELDSFYKKTEKSYPAFLERYAVRVNEVEGDLMAIETGGRAGSTRKLIALERRGELKKSKKKDKSE